MTYLLLHNMDIFSPTWDCYLIAKKLMREMKKKKMEGGLLRMLCPSIRNDYREGGDSFIELLEEKTGSVNFADRATSSNSLPGHNSQKFRRLGSDTRVKPFIIHLFIHLFFKM